MADKNDRHDPTAIPQEGSIQRGKVIRIEPSFCIIQLQGYHRMRGLLHVSEMPLNGAKLEECLSLDDVLYCRVLSITEEATSEQQEQGTTGRPRYRIRLSTRNVDMDTCETTTDTSLQQQQQLSQHLNSTIGMGVALDPMAAASSSGNLILKHGQQRSGALINGYALVGDTEGEPDIPPPDPSKAVNVSRPGRDDEASKPMGRGRGATLPAWMTRGKDSLAGQDDRESSSGGGHGAAKNERKERKKQHREDGQRCRRHHHRNRKHHSRSRRRKHHRDDDDEAHRHNSPQHRSSTDTDESLYSAERRNRKWKYHDGRDDGKGGRRRHGGRKRRKTTRDRNASRSPSSDSEERHRRYRRDRRSSRGRRRNDCSDDEASSRRDQETRVKSEDRQGEGDERIGRNGKGTTRRYPDADFPSVAEAKRVIAELEDKRRRRQRHSD